MNCDDSPLGLITINALVEVEGNLYKIRAIKAVRAIFEMERGYSLGLKEAKGIVDGIQDGTYVLEIRTVSDSQRYIYTLALESTGLCFKSPALPRKFTI